MNYKKLGYTLKDPCQPCHRNIHCYNCDHFNASNRVCSNCRSERGLMRDRLMKQIGTNPRVWSCPNCGNTTIELFGKTNKKILMEDLLCRKNMEI